MTSRLGQRWASGTGTGGEGREGIPGGREGGDGETSAGPQTHGHSSEFGFRDPSGLYRPTETLTPAKCIFSAQPCARNTVVMETAQLYLPGSSEADRPIPTRRQTKMGKVGMGEAGGDF